jgi:nucleotide-binding universal stress UspA family protein
MIQAESEARAHLEVLAQDLRSRGSGVQSRVVRAPAAAAQILHEAAADPIVISTRGRGGARRTVFGSVTDEVVRGALGPVLVVPSRAVAGG